MSSSRVRKGPPKQHSDPLDQQMLKDIQIVPQEKGQKNARKKKRDPFATPDAPQPCEESEEEYPEVETSIGMLEGKMSKRLYSKVLSCQKKLEEEELSTPKSRSVDFANHEEDEWHDEHPDEGLLAELDALYVEQENLDNELKHEDRDLFEEWTRPSLQEENTSQVRTLAEIILEKLEQFNEEKKRALSSPTPTEPVLPEKVVLVYQKLGVLLSRYRSGKLPKAFKVLPVLTNWNEVLAVTNPDLWTPHAVYQATRLFASTVQPHQAQLFYESILLPHVRENIAAHKRLNVYLYDALKKALYKPSAFFKGIIFPLCSAGNCTLREAVIVASIIAKQSIPVLHSAACLLKLSEMEYSGALSIFIRTLLDKKYSLPKRVISSMVTHFVSLQNDPRPCYLLWHQSLLVFVQRTSLSDTEKEAIRELCRFKHHEHVTPEVLRELGSTAAMQPLLLRLFQSDFFNTWIAVSYLYKYTDPGIQLYLCKRLLDQPIGEISFLLPQLCHLLVIREASETVSLENLLLHLGIRWTHISIKIVWLLESYEGDLIDNETKAKLARLKSKFQSTLLQNDKTTFLAAFGQVSISSVKSLLVGMGAVAASVIAPQDLEECRMLTLQQGFARNAEDQPEDQQVSSYSVTKRKSMPYQLLKIVAEKLTPSWEEFYGGRAFSLQRSLTKLESIFKPLSSQGSREKSPLHEKETGSLQTSRVHSGHRLPSYSKDSHQAMRSSINESDDNSNQEIQTKYSGESNEPEDNDPNQSFQSSFLSSLLPNIQSTHYFHAQMTFISALTTISERLSRIPKPSRQKALQAELSLLNHNLPANVCIPFWCCESERKSSSFPHARVLRISPTEAVVLNSAERVPFMILVEVESNSSELSGAQHTPYASNPTISSSCSSDNNIDQGKEENVDYSNHLSKSASGTSEFFERMRTAAILLAQLHQMTTTKVNINHSTVSAIRSRILKEMERLDGQKPVSDALDEFHSIDDDDLNILKQSISIDDPSCKILKESWEDKARRVQKSSPFGSRPGWTLYSLIVKSSADLRQELLAVQIIREMLDIWKEAAGEDNSYILVVSGDSGLIETITDSISLHSLKKEGLARLRSSRLLKFPSNESAPSLLESTESAPMDVSEGFVSEADLEYPPDAEGVLCFNERDSGSPPPQTYTLLDYFIETYGSTKSKAFMSARECFLSSLVGYSLLTYILALKDRYFVPNISYCRHNGNILIDKWGHLIHIDFGFMLSNSPGYVGFESAPFKLLIEWVEVLGGPDSVLFREEFRVRFVKAFLAIRKHSDRILLLVEMMMRNSSLPCFYSGADLALYHLRERFVLSYTDGEVVEYVEKLIAASYDNMFTKLYDSFQYYSNGIL